MPIPADAAAWIRDVVLTPAYRAGVGDRTTCPCQGSPSGHCDHGNHEQCPRTWGWHRHGQPDPDTYITNSRGLVAVARGVASAAVWRTGRACRWLCPCTCHTTVTALFDPPAREAPRPSVADGNTRITSTDRLKAFDGPQPTLFDLASTP